ncbi:MAG: hypothetical protein RIB46_01230 [Pseudomonadales bacterium]
MSASRDPLAGLRGAERLAAIQVLQARFWVAIEPGGRWHGPYPHWWQAKRAARACARDSGRDARIARYGDGSGLNWRLNADRPRGFAEKRPQARPKPTPRTSSCIKRLKTGRTSHA